MEPETSKRNYHYPLRNNPEDRSSNEPLKMGPIGCLETSIRNYHFSLRNDTERRSSNKQVVTFFMKIFHCIFLRQDSFGTLFYSLRIRLKSPPSKYALGTGVLISPYPDQEGNKLQRQKILKFIYPIYNHNWRNISTIYICIYIYIYI